MNKNAMQRAGGFSLAEVILVSSLTALVAGGASLVMGSSVQNLRQQQDQSGLRAEGIRIVSTLEAQGSLVMVKAQEDGSALLQFATGEEIDACQPSRLWPTKNVVVHADARVNGEVVAPRVKWARVVPDGNTAAVFFRLEDDSLTRATLLLSTPRCSVEELSQEQWVVNTTTPSELGTSTRFTREPEEPIVPPSEREPTYYSDRDGNLISEEEWDALPEDQRFKRSDRDGYSQPDPWRPGQPEPGECVGDDCRPSHWKPS